MKVRAAQLARGKRSLTFVLLQLKVSRAVHDDKGDTSDTNVFSISRELRSIQPSKNLMDEICVSFIVSQVIAGRGNSVLIPV